MRNLFIFDLGKVLIDFDFNIAIKKLDALGGVDHKKVLALFMNSVLSKAWDTGSISDEQFFQIVKEELELSISKEEFVRIWNEIFTEKHEMIDLALSLKPDWKIWILSNTNPWHAEYIRKQFGWISRFNGFIASCDVHLLKPDPKIFELAIKKSESNGQKILYLDDIWENVHQAKSLGIDAIVFKSREDFLNELKRRNIEPPARLSR